MKKLLIAGLFLFMAGNILGAELGAGGGSGYPAVIDTDASVESSATIARADVPNDLADAIIKIQTELGVDPSGGYATVADRIDDFTLYVDTITEQNIGGTKTFNDGIIVSTITLSVAVTRYYSISAADFTPKNNDQLWQMLEDKVRANSGTVELRVHAGVHLPQGAVVISFKGYWYRDDAAATGSLLFRRYPATGTIESLADANSDSSGGNHTVEDTSIMNATIDNSAYMYTLILILDPNNSSVDVALYGGLITYTITDLTQ